VTEADAGETAQALRDLAAAGRDFGRALPRSRPLAETALLRAGELVRAGQAAAAVPLCRGAVAGLRALAAGTAPSLLAPCLDAFGAEAAHAAEGAARQALLAELAAAAQLVQGGMTSRQIAQATARLAENARDPRVAAAIRRRDDAAAALQALYRQRDEPGAPAVAEAEIRASAAALAEADADLQAASPNFGQLIQPVVPAGAVLAALAPQEALAEIVLGPTDGWVVLLHDGRIDAGRVPAGEAAVARLVARLRAGAERPALPAGFDTAAAQELYRLVLGPVAPALADVTRLVVAPGGPLLALPFGVLLTGPADAAHLADAPWLLRRMTVVHVPSSGNFVSLRRIAAGSRAARPWFGFGAALPLSAALAAASFPAAECGDSARLLAGLPALPGARRELAAAGALLGGAAGGDALLGSAFTVPAVLAAPLKQYRVLHFAAHALLPAELRCLDQPAIVASAPAGAQDAAGALLTASDVTGLDLDADLVILSACDTGGPDGGAAGESLSGLARAFFYAGARTLLVTHWPVNDQVAAYLVADTLARLRAAPALGAAGALRAAQLALLAGAGRDLPASVAQPFFWAAFAAIGEGGGSVPSAQASLPSPAGL
jgi:CHAT domain-containing protein